MTAILYTKPCNDPSKVPCGSSAHLYASVVSKSLRNPTANELSQLKRGVEGDRGLLRLSG